MRVLDWFVCQCGRRDLYLGRNDLLWAVHSDGRVKNLCASEFDGLPQVVRDKIYAMRALLLQR